MDEPEFLSQVARIRTSAAKVKQCGVEDFRGLAPFSICCGMSSARI
ncbi:hypothetical protein [Rhizobium bangladeshense]|nr:hypothetical protein [Rhizobium bangladeshense]MBY3600054.1 hypothetical protein [Rhizobium bangladeshense]